jgi:cytochrome b subunit of formate dehydrogenase
MPINQAGAAPKTVAGRYYRRFGLYERVQHAGMMFAFIGCALSGLPLLFPYTGWARAIAGLMGGFEGAALVHRVSATLMAVVFLAHIVQFLWRGLGSGTLLSVLWGPNSLVPQWKDITDIWDHMKYFLGKGQRPQFDRYTYWEKFDYMAVFWGMFIIGGSGLVLWFAEALSPWLPGWVFNVCTLVHGHEALLAVGFIFTIHFFNSHLRPEKFPMDPVIFTGRISEHELIDERTDEYERLRAARTLHDHRVGPGAHWVPTLAKAVAVVAVTLGLVMVVMIVSAVLF